MSSDCSGGLQIDQEGCEKRRENQQQQPTKFRKQILNSQIKSIRVAPWSINCQTTQDLKLPDSIPTRD